ncbi:MAG TPA: 2-oxoacid:acceptor oxidoreductase subunit alpha, partial [Candidatus Brocadiales bacterium]|nr:2-oxoacid:acceptor oxidoreductase subunit alpha [Candidatus Brocadiales bacterium]
RMGQYFLQGNDACAEGAIAAGCRFFAGYPISPSSEIMERMMRRLPEVNGVFIQMEDEISSIAAVIGASWAGAKAMTATSGPGLSLMMENIGYAVMTETPCVIVDVQRVGPSTGQATRPAHGDMMQVKWGSHGDYQIIALSPWSVQEMYDETVRAFNLAETYRVPVFVMADAALGHLRENCELKDDVEIVNRRKRKGAPHFGTSDDGGIPPASIFGEGENLLITGSTHDEWGFRKTQDAEVQEWLVKRLSNKILQNVDKIIQTDEYLLEDADVAIVSYGITARACLAAVKIARQNGAKVGLLRLKTIWPFPDSIVKQVGMRVKKVIVPEMNLGQIVREVQRLVPERIDQGVVKTDVIPFSKVNGEVITPEEIHGAINHPAVPSLRRRG